MLDVDDLGVGCLGWALGVGRWAATTPTRDLGDGLRGDARHGNPNADGRGEESTRLNEKKECGACCVDGGGGHFAGLQSNPNNVIGSGISHPNVRSRRRRHRPIGGEGPVEKGP